MNTLKVTLLIIIAVSGVSFGRDIYVAKTGNDSNPGTLTNPYLTIGKAASEAVAGDVCYIREGTYKETLSPVNSGTSSNPIVFQAYQYEQVVISAVNEITGWTQHSGSIYKAPVQMALNEQNMLYCDGQRMDLARWPNNADGNLYTLEAELVLSGSASHIEAAQVLNIDWTGGYIWYLGAHSGTSWTRPITSTTSTEVHYEAVDITDWPFDPHNPTVWRNGNRGRFFLFNALGALDIPGEWYYSPTEQMLYFRAPDDINPNQTTTEFAALQYTMDILQDYIHVDSIDAFGGSIHIAGDHCIVRNGHFIHCLQRLDELDNTDAQVGAGAVVIDASYVTVENNIIEYSSANGIVTSGAWKGYTDALIRNNIIRYVNTIAIHSSGVRANYPSTRILNNTIQSCGRDGIVNFGVDSEIAYNDVSECMLLNNDGGVLYTVGNELLKNTEIHHNWFHDSIGPDYADGRAAGVYLDNGSRGYVVHHNVIWNVTWSALQANWYNTHIDFFNNSVWDVGAFVGRWANGYPVGDNRVWNNVSNVGPFTVPDFPASTATNILTTTSPFVDVANGDFRLTSGSSPIDAGTVITGITDGYVGSAPDVGAYEYGGEDWVAGANITISNTPYGGSPATIPGKIEAEEYDVGGEGVAYYDTTAGNAGGEVRTDDVDIEARDGGYTVGWIADGEWLEYTVNATTGTYDLTARVASTNSAASFNVSLSGNQIATVNVPDTTDWGQFEDVVVPDIFITGDDDVILRIEFSCPSGGLNLNWIEFTQIPSSPYSGTPSSLPGKLQAEEYDLGGEGIAYHDTTAGNTGNDFRTDDVDITDQYGGHVLAWTNEEEWLKYTVNAAAGTYDITVRASTGITNRNVTLTLDGNVLGTINIPNMGWSTFGGVTLADVVIPATSSGILQLNFNGGVNIDWIDFTLLKGDVNFSGAITIDDLTILASQWLTDCLVESVCADVDYSGKVDLSDFEILSAGWMMP